MASKTSTIQDKHHETAGNAARIFVIVLVIHIVAVGAAVLWQGMRRWQQPMMAFRVDPAAESTAEDDIHESASTASPSASAPSASSTPTLPVSKASPESGPSPRRHSHVHVHAGQALLSAVSAEPSLGKGISDVKTTVPSAAVNSSPQPQPQSISWESVSRRDVVKTSLRSDSQTAISSATKSLKKPQAAHDGELDHRTLSMATPARELPPGVPPAVTNSAVAVVSRSQPSAPAPVESDPVKSIASASPPPAVQVQETPPAPEKPASAVAEQETSVAPTPVNPGPQPPVSKEDEPTVKNNPHTHLAKTKDGKDNKAKSHKSTPTPSATVAASGSYKVRKGETYYSISKKLHVSLHELMVLNSDKKASGLYEGVKLKLPAKHGASGATRQG